MTAPSPHPEPGAAGLELEPLRPSPIDRRALVALASACGAPRVTLLWRVTADAQPPGAGLAALVIEAEAELARRSVPPGEATAILAPARALLTAPRPSPSFQGSLALHASATEARLFALPWVAPSQAWVSGRYRVSHLVPLLRTSTSTSMARHRLALGITAGRARLDLADVLVQARAGRLALLFAALRARAWGTFDASGRVELHATRWPDDEELVDLAVAYALGHGAEVHVLRGDRVDGGGSVAALVRG